VLEIDPPEAVVVLPFMLVLTPAFVSAFTTEFVTVVFVAVSTVLEETVCAKQMPAALIPKLKNRTALIFINSPVYKYRLTTLE
jgi:hypothetical protein